MNATPRAPIAAPPGALAKRYEAVRAATSRLVAPLSAEDCGLQSMPDASPAKWHLAHTTWYFETFVLEAADAPYRPFDASRTFRVMFNSYYHSVGEQHLRPERALLSRPSLDEVMAYRAHVDAAILDRLHGGHFDAELLEVLLLGTHHEQQHQELILTDLKHAFARNPLGPVYREPGMEQAASATPRLAELDYQAYPAGLYEIGHDGEGFAFDNEGPRHRVHLEAFELAQRPATNGEFQDFMQAGGYSDPLHWLSDGWIQASTEGWQAPLYWRPEAEGWAQFTLSGWRPVKPDEPACHLSYYEADAFARWAGARLPTEAEWEVAVAGLPVAGNTVESEVLAPRPAPTLGSLQQCFGDVWEWTASAYGAYPGFRPPRGALGEYNGKFMSGQMVLRGGSCVSPGDHLRASYRNFFHPGSRWQFSGVRLARDPRPLK